MDDLSDAIQDAVYIGAMCDPAPLPQQPLELVSDEEALAFASKLKASNAEALTFEAVLSETLGYYLVSFCEFVCVCALGYPTSSQARARADAWSLCLCTLVNAMHLSSSSILKQKGTAKRFFSWKLLWSTLYVTMCSSAMSLMHDL